jgi:hypothetical protein
VRRFVDRGAITAAWVGVGMAVTIAVSFLLVIPIEALYLGFIAPGFPIGWLSGLTIGYYANTRSQRAGGPWGRILANAALAGLATGVTFALLFLLLKGLFFAVDNGYRDASAGGPITCQTGAECVYLRYLDSPQGELFEENGITDVESFTAFFWSQQLQLAAGLGIATLLTGVAGGAVFRLSNAKRPEDAAAPGAPASG